MSPAIRSDFIIRATLFGQLVLFAIARAESFSSSSTEEREIVGLAGRRLYLRAVRLQPRARHPSRSR